ncbi:hypothetical protein [Reinekea sp. G2M2-21]|uniref:hypothetical protein n=1 Tax=Reinekea sp. G2M2-21 TaxID=2788942 RepID=UPI0018AC3B26|nr:hypothetical protein [Reinekea sp. G2M2-21]
MVDRKLPQVDENVQISEPISMNEITSNGEIKTDEMAAFEDSPIAPSASSMSNVDVFSLEAEDNVTDIRRSERVIETFESSPTSEEIQIASSSLDALEDSPEKMALNGLVDFSEDIKADYFNLDHYSGEVPKHDLIQDDNFNSVVERLFESSNQVVHQTAVGDNNIVALRLPSRDSALFEALNKTPLNTTSADSVEFRSGSMLVLDATGKASLFEREDERMSFESPNPSLYSSPADANSENSSPKPEPDQTPSELDILQQQLKRLEEEAAADRAHSQQNMTDEERAEAKRKAEEAGRLTLFNFGNKQPGDTSIARRRQARMHQLEDQIRALATRHRELGPQIKQDTKRNVLSKLKSKFVRGGSAVIGAEGLTKAEQRFVRLANQDPGQKVRFMGLLTDRAKQLTNELNAIQQLSGIPGSEPQMRVASNRVNQLINGGDGFNRQLLALKAMDIGKSLESFKSVPGAKETFEELSSALTDLRRHPMATKHAVGGKKLSQLPVLKQLSDLVNNAKAVFNEMLENVKGLWSKRER